MAEVYDIIIFGGGISGFSTAMRLQAKGFKTLVLEAHGQLGGCSGFFTKKGFSFDVGATTLVDFVPGGVGGNFFKDIGLELPKGEYLDYVAWLPDRQITLYRDHNKWHKERLEKIGASSAHLKFWKLMDKVTDVFWNASRKNIKLPIANLKDLIVAINSIGIRNLHLTKHINHTILDVLKEFKLENDKPLTGLLAILVEDTVHSTLDKAPFINAALGTTIRGAGLMRAEGGMKKYWELVSAHYLKAGGTIKRGTKVLNFCRTGNSWEVSTNKGIYKARKVISSLPIDLTSQIAPANITIKLKKHIEKNEAHKGSAIVLFLGVKDSVVSNQPLTHHQLLQDYNKSLGNGNNMFISVSAKGDVYSAPAGYRSVMISTHCEIAEWQNLSEKEYKDKKKAIGEVLLLYAKRVYPKIDEEPIVYEIGTPRTYEIYTGRINGSVGGFKQTLSNSNQNAIPNDIGIKDFWLVGDNTWPGLGTVAGLISSRVVADLVF
ncbi:MAG: FAD-dependent oxidoreductase [Pedobacter sp.]|nr:MAG: FAD-dependent oxidoreductase [Pedobacter sp.]